MPVPQVAGLAVPTAVAYAYLPRSTKTGPGVEDSIGKAMGAQSLGSVVGLQQTRVVYRVWHIGIHDRIRVLFRELHFHVIWRGCRSGVRVVLRRSDPQRNLQGGPPSQRSQMRSWMRNQRHCRLYLPWRPSHQH